MIKEASDFFQNAKFCPILVIYNLPDGQCLQICMNKKLSFNFLAVVGAARSPERFWCQTCFNQKWFEHGKQKIMYTNTTF